MLYRLKCIATAICVSGATHTDDESGLLQMKELDSIRDVNMADVTSSLTDRALKKPPMSLLIRKADSQIAKIFREYRQEPAQIAQSVQIGIQAILDAASQFQQGNIDQGITALRDGLLAAIEAPLQGAEGFASGSDNYNQFVEGFRAFFSQVQSMQTIVAKLTAYHEGGEVSDLISAIDEIFNVLEANIVGQIPPETSEEVMKFLDAIEQVVATTCEAVEALESGEGEDAIEPFYRGIRTAIDTVLPESVRTHQAYTLVTGTLDGVMGNLSDTISMYKQAMIEANTCWKHLTRAGTRERELPSSCSHLGDGWMWFNGTTWCMRGPPPSASLTEIEVSETAFVGKGTTDKHQPEGSFPSICGNSELPERHGRHCYAPCPSNTVQAEGGGCRTRCGHDFSADGNNLCGRSQGHINAAVNRMLVETLGTVLQVGVQAFAMYSSGNITADSLSNVVTSLSRIGLPFAKPTCSDDHVGAAV